MPDRLTPEPPSESDAYRRILEAGGELSQPRFDIDAQWTKLDARVSERPRGRVSSVLPGYLVNKDRRYMVSWAVLAAVMMVAAVGVWGKLVRPTGQPIREFTSGPASRSSVTLRDGTRLVLGPDTHLRVPADFGWTTRSVELEGEAYFAVVHDAAHPFSVLAHGVRTQDVGTAFDIRAYADDRNVRIAVTEGAVSVGAGLRPARLSNTATLTAGDMATASDTGISITHNANVAMLISWMQSNLAFEDAPLRDVVRDIGHAFGVTVWVADSTLLNRKITATFADQPLDVVLNEVTQALGARYERTGHTVVIRSGSTTGTGKRVDPRPPLATAQATTRQE